MALPEGLHERCAKLCGDRGKVTEIEGGLRIDLRRADHANTVRGQLMSVLAGYGKHGLGVYVSGNVVTIGPKRAEEPKPKPRKPEGLTPSPARRRTFGAPTAKQDQAYTRLVAEARREIATRPDWLRTEIEFARDLELAGQIRDHISTAPDRLTALRRAAACAHHLREWRQFHYYCVNALVNAAAERLYGSRELSLDEREAASALREALRKVKSAGRVRGFRDLMQRL